MATISSRELRNYTATVLKRVSQGETYTVTVHGRAVAELRRVASQRRSGVPRAELVALLDRQRSDGTLTRRALAEDMAWISERTTDDIA